MLNKQNVKLLVIIIVGVFMLTACQKTVKLKNGDKYVGNVTLLGFGKKDGNGTYTYKNGDEYIGEFKNDKLLGKGVLSVKADNTKYEGNFGEKIFEGKVGTINKDKPASVGDLKCNIESLFEKDKDKKIFKGYFKGKIYDDNGKLMSDGTIDGDIPWGDDKNGTFEFTIDGKTYEDEKMVMDGKFNTKISDGKVANLNGKGKIYQDGQLIMDADITGFNEVTKTGEFNGKMYENGKMVMDGKIKLTNDENKNQIVDGNGTMITSDVKIVGQFNVNAKTSTTKFNGKMYQNDKLLLDGNFTCEGSSIKGTGKIYDVNTGKVIKDGDISS